MKITTKQITTTAVLLALCIVSQFFKNASVFITGPIINACIILAGLSVGMGCGIILAIITPITSFFITGSPIMSVMPAIIPCIMIGNMIIVILTCLLDKKISGKLGLVTGLLTGSICKALFMGVVISLIIVPAFLPDAMAPKMHSIQMTFSVIQLLTALIGSIYAFILWIPLKKVMTENAQA